MGGGMSLASKPPSTAIAPNTTPIQNPSSGPPLQTPFSKGLTARLNLSSASMH
jgi:hypothetical protein